MKPTQAQEIILENMLRTGANGQTRFRPEIGPSLMSFSRVVGRGWAEEIEPGLYRITEAGRAVMQRKPAQ